jgi:hypothetical protein
LLKNSHSGFSDRLEVSAAEVPTYQQSSEHERTVKYLDGIVDDID